MGVLLAGLLWAGTSWAGNWMPALAALCAIVVLGELYALGRRTGLRPQAPVGLIAIVSLAVIGHVKGDRVSRALVGVVLALIVGTFGDMLVRTDRRRLIETVLASVIPSIFVAIPVAYLTAMRVMPEGERLVGTLLLAVFGAELVARVAARVTGAGRGGEAAGSSRASLIRTVGAVVGAAAGVVVAQGVFVPEIARSVAWSLAGVGAVAVAASQPVAVLVETVAAPGLQGRPALIRSASGLLLAIPFAFYAFVLLAR